jgi:ABC-2 type transport system permease protein
VSGLIVLATCRRVLRQIRHDPRTIALVIGVPCLLLVLLRFVFDGQQQTFQQVGVPLIGIFPLISMFLVTSISLLRERISGTLERLMTMPLAKADLLFGYGIAFAGVAVVQALVTTAVGVGLLGLDVQGTLAMVILLAVLNAVLGSSLGLFASAFAATEFQVVQFMPAFVLPQLLLCGLFVSRDAMAGALHAISDVLPMTYAYDGLSRVAESSAVSSGLIADIAVVAAYAVAALLASAATLRRRTA